MSAIISHLCSIFQQQQQQQQRAVCRIYDIDYIFYHRSYYADSLFNPVHCRPKYSPHLLTNSDNIQSVFYQQMLIEFNNLNIMKSVHLL